MVLINACALVLDVETGNTLAYTGNAYHPEDPGIAKSRRCNYCTTKSWQCIKTIAVCLHAQRWVTLTAFSRT